jgi:hypothetical protein
MCSRCGCRWLHKEGIGGGGGEKAGRSPVDRAKQGIRRSVALEADGIPLGFATAPANRHDSYFYGLRVHLVSTASGEPVEFTLAAASEADISLFKELKLGLPERAIIHADKGYTDYHYEDLLEDVGLHLVLRTTIDSSFLERWRGDSTLAVLCVVGARWEHKVGRRLFTGVRRRSILGSRDHRAPARS